MPDEKPPKRKQRNEIIIPDPAITPRWGPGMTQRVWRKWKREHKKYRQRAAEAERLRFEEEVRTFTERQRALRAADTVSVRLFGSGHATESNPSGRMGVITHFLWLSIGVTVFGVLYRLSFTWIGFVLSALLYLYIRHEKKKKGTSG
jgi:hypothetical protein